MEKTAALLAACGGAIGLGFTCGTALAGLPFVPIIAGTMIPEVLGGVLHNVLEHLVGNAAQSSSSLGRNHDIVRLMGDAANHCARELAEERPLWKIHLWGERWSLERSARRLADEWSAIDRSTLGAACRAPEVVTWFQTSSTDATQIPPPLTLNEWKAVLSGTCPNLAGHLQDELAGVLELRFTHWVRQRFKDDFLGETPAKGRAFAALQMSLIGGLYEILGEMAESVGQVEQNSKNLALALPMLDQRVDDLASDLKFRQLPNLVRHVRKVGRRTQQLIQRIHAPYFSLPTPDKSNERARFDFSNERFEVVGRDIELRKLSEWLHDRRQFSWDLWTGPTGVGKRRLALKLCRESTGWDVGFYNWAFHHLVRWDIWEPRKRTLIVFDNAADHAKELRQVLSILAERQHWPDRVRVRLLLLERQVPRSGLTNDSDNAIQDETNSSIPVPSWVTQLVGQSVGRQFRESHARQNVDQPDRLLEGLSPDAVVQIILEDAGVPDQPDLDEAEILRRAWEIVKIDPDCRPLYVIMAAEALREGGEVAAWDTQMLVTHVLSREQTHWDNSLAEAGLSIPEQLPWKRLLCLSTMCGDLKGDRLESALDAAHRISAGLPIFTSWGNGEVFRRLVAGGGSRDALALKPDIVGEAFVLSHLQQDPLVARQLINLGWSYGAGKFIVRAMQDFPNHPTCNVLLTFSQKSDISVLAAAHHARWSRISIIDGTTAAGDYGASLAANVEQPPSLRAIGALFWAKYLSPNFAIEPFLTTLQTLGREGSNDSTARERVAGALAFAISRADRKPGQTDPLIDELYSLVKAYPDDANIREQLAYGLLFAFDRAKPNSGRAYGLLDQLRNLLRRYPDDTSICERLATAFFNAFTRAEDNSARANGLLTKLRALLAAYPQIEIVRERLAWALSNALAVSGGDSARADALIDELRILLRPDIDGVTAPRLFAIGLFNAYVHAAHDSPRADRLLSELRTLVEKFPDIDVAREYLADGLQMAFVRAKPGTPRADGHLQTLLVLSAESKSSTKVRIAALQAFLIAFDEAWERGVVKSDEALAVRALPPIEPKDEQSRQLTLAILDELAAVEQSADLAGPHDGKYYAAKRGHAQLHAARSARSCLQAVYDHHFPMSDS